MSDCVIIFYWIELSLFANTGVDPFVTVFVTRYKFHRFSLSSVKQVSHSWHIVLDTCALYTFLNFISHS